MFITLVTYEKGVAGGLLWPSQGRYFAKNAKLYAENSSIPVEKVYKAHTVIFLLQFLIKLKGELHLRRNLCHFILRL